ncbi:MAG: RIO1 family regulatory kinase/ATPase [Candidatus Diapherotrites archaeon]
MLSLEERLEKFLDENSLKKIEKISKGWSSEIYLVENLKSENSKEENSKKENSEKEKFALKIEREKSPRENMAKKEVENLKLANSVNIGPKLISWDFEKRVILMQYIPGKTFQDWIHENPSREDLQKVMQDLFFQARELDKLGLDHGQLAGPGKNILVWDTCPIIIDFEKASIGRKTHNANVLQALFHHNPSSAITKKIQEILTKK